VQLDDDAVAEGTEVFTMNLSDPSANATIARKSATATIIDNDAPPGTPQVSIGDLVVDEAAGTANFVITLDRPSAGVVSMDYANQDGAPITGAAAAQAGSDYVAASGTLNFAPGETAKTVKVSLINGTLQEGAEAFSLALSGLVGATALDPVGTAVIGANDEPVVLRPTIWVDDVVVGEEDGFADFVIRLDAPTRPNRDLGHDRDQFDRQRRRERQRRAKLASRRARLAVTQYP
jgi:Calx-beta domain